MRVQVEMGSFSHVETPRKAHESRRHPGRFKIRVKVDYMVTECPVLPFSKDIPITVCCRVTVRLADAEYIFPSRAIQGATMVILDVMAEAVKAKELPFLFACSKFVLFEVRDARLLAGGFGELFAAVAADIGEWSRGLEGSIFVQPLTLPEGMAVVAGLRMTLDVTFSRKTRRTARARAPVRLFGSMLPV
jgi:hypothetical protein